MIEHFRVLVFSNQVYRHSSHLTVAARCGFGLRVGFRVSVAALSPSVLMAVLAVRRRRRAGEFCRSRRGPRWLWGLGQRPAPRQNLEAFRAIRSLDDFGVQPRQNSCQGVLKLPPLISAVGKEFAQNCEHAEQRFENQEAAIAVLNVGRMNDSMQHEA